MIKQDIWTILETYSFVQGFLIGLYAIFILKRPFLAALLLSISILILSHLFYHFRWYYSHPHLIFIEAPLWYLIGPFFYFFVLKLFNVKLSYIHLLHLIPLIAFLIYIFPFYMETAAEKVRIHDVVFGEEVYSRDYTRYIFTAIFFAYVIASYITFEKKSKYLKQFSSQSTLILDVIVSYTLRYYLIFAFLGFACFVIVGHDYYWSDIYYDFYYVGLSVLIHFIFYYCLMRSEFGESVSEDNNLMIEESGKYHSSSLTEQELDLIIKQVTSHISKFDVYRNPELRLRMVSDELNIPAHHISQAINQNLGKNFFDLVNGYRIDGVKENIHDEKFKNYTLVGIASEHGFKSPSSFYRIFKKYVGKTPKEFFSEQ